MSCPTSFNGVFFGLISPGLPCSAQGVCVNVTEFSPNFDSLCVCNQEYSGECDMFDLEVLKLPNGTNFSLDCPNPRIGVTIMFSLQLLALTFREIILVLSLLLLCRQKSVGLCCCETNRDTPYRVVLFDALIANPITMGFPILKLLPFGFVVGTDILTTLCLVFGTFLLTACFNEFEFYQFKNLVQASSMDYEMHEVLTRRQRYLMNITKLSYLTFGVIPSLVALGLDKSVGPISNGEYICLILRNIGIIVWATTQWFCDLFMHRELSKIAALVRSVASTGGTTRLLDYLDNHTKQTRKTCFVASAIWIFFSIPYFFPFQGYAMTIVTILATLGTGNEGLVLLASAYVSRKSRDTRAKTSFVQINTNDETPNLTPKIAN